MRSRSCVARGFAVIVAGVVAAASSAHAPAAFEQNKKPSISLKANPPVGFAPLRVVVTAELKGGADDFQDFYCASVEWDWGDDTKSENTIDCDPYEPGKSEIKRRYVMEHTFRAQTMGGVPSTFDPSGSGGQPPSVQYRVRFTLKQKNKTVGSGQTTVEIRQGIGGH
jgi:hypothetical protein